MGGTAVTTLGDTYDASCIHIPRWGSIGSGGMATDELVASVANAAIAVVSAASLVYYFIHSYSSTCGWEEVYVCCVELVKVFLELFFEACAPVTFNETTGSHVVWIRYAEWLLTCPAILIHLSNLTGLADDYNKRTMILLMSDIGTIVMGITAALASGYIKVFFTSWAGYPVLFMLGTEGFFGVLSPFASVAAHCLVDVLSKNLWGLLGHHLRIQVHEFIIVHGMVRARRTRKLLGGLFELEVETLVRDESTSGAVRTSVAGIAQRRSFQNVMGSMARRGKMPRASFTASQAGSTAGAASAAAGWLAGDTSWSQIGALGSPVWRSSVTGQLQRVHPASISAASARLSLDWPKFGSGRASAINQGGAAEPGAEPGSEDAHGGGEVVTCVAVRSRASVGKGHDDGGKQP